MPTVHLDFETYSAAPLRTVGAWVYSEHKSTEALCMAYAIDSGDVKLWLPGEPLPDFVQHPTDFDLYAHNSAFECVIWRNVLDWPNAPFACWHDTAAMAAAMALPRSLGGAGAALKLPQDKQKDKRGKFLIQRLCQPYRGKRVRDEALLAELHRYCMQDVEAERELCKHLRPMSEQERAVWLLDQEVNARGVPVDMPSVDHALAIYEQLHDSLYDELKEITGIDNPNSRIQFMEWLEANGVEVMDTQKNTLKALLEVE